MTEDPLRDLLRSTTPQVDLDVGALRRRLDRRLRRRLVVQVAVVVAVLTTLLPMLTAVRGSVPPEVVLTDADGLVAVGSGLTEQAHQPTRLPPSYRRCTGPDVEGPLIVTSFCASGRPTLRLAVGSHLALPEQGDPISLGFRTATVRESRGTIQLTVSDDNSLDDTHLRLSAEGLDLEVLAAVLASVPAVRDAPPSPS